jgi:tetratricopeptide (TPR) repeat protein
MTKAFSTPTTRLGFLVSLILIVILVLTSSCVGADSVEQHLQTAQAAFSRGDLDAAEAEARLSLEEAERRFGSNDQRTGQSWMWLAFVYQAKGRTEEAKRASERRLDICEKTFGPDHLETAAAMSMLASIYSGAGDFPKAESLLRRSLAIKEKGFGPDHPYTAVTASSLADLLVEKGEYVEAERLNRRSLAAVEKAWSPTDPSVPIGFRLNTPTIMEGLARVSIGQGRFKEAEDLLTRAARLRIAIVGSEHLSMVGNWTILGLAYQAQGRNADAEKAYREALPIADKTFGSESLAVSNLLALVADSCVMQGKRDAAVDLYSRSVTIDEHISAPGPLRAKHLRGYANVLKVRGRAQEAAQAEQRAQEMR